MAALNPDPRPQESAEEIVADLIIEARAIASWMIAEQKDKMTAQEIADAIFAAPSVQAFVDAAALSRLSGPAGDAEPVAYMVDTGDKGSGWPVRIWTAKRRKEAEGCAEVFGVPMVPLYGDPAFLARSPAVAPVAPADYITVPRVLSEAMREALHNVVEIECRPSEQSASILNEDAWWQAILDAALSHGRKVIVVGPVEHTWTNHRNVHHAADLSEARELWMPWLTTLSTLPPTAGGEPTPAVGGVGDAGRDHSGDVAEMVDLREEVAYWRRDAAARMWMAQALMQARRKEGRDDLAFAHSDALRAAVGASEEVQAKHWHSSCEICGKPMLPGEATYYFAEEGISAHDRCAVESAADDTGAPDPCDDEWRQRTKDGRAALSADDEDPETDATPAPAAAQSPAAGAGLRELLKAHHDWHLAQGVDNGGTAGIDLAEAYSETDLCSLTVEALDAPSSDRGGARDRWRSMDDKPPEDTEGDVWNDLGNGLEGRIADCLFNGGRWIYQPYPFGEWEPVEHPIAWRPVPSTPRPETAP